MHHERLRSREQTAVRNGRIEGRALKRTFTTRSVLFDAPPARIRPRGFWPTVLGVTALSMWSGSVACLWINEPGLVFRAAQTRDPRPHPGSGLFQLTTSDGVSLDAMALRAEPASAYWILFCPPSGRTIHGSVRRQLESLRDAGYNLVAFDYRGFGRNRGTPSERGVYADAEAAYRHLTQDRGIAPGRIILAGRSLGSAVAIELATRVPSAGLLLFSAIDSVPAVASRYWFWAPVGLLATQRFDSMAKAPRVTVPVVQVHATGDWLVPIEAARVLFGRFPGRRVMLELPGGHNDVGLEWISRPASDAAYTMPRAARVGESLARTLLEVWPARGTPGPE